MPHPGGGRDRTFALWVALRLPDFGALKNDRNDSTGSYHDPAAGQGEDSGGADKPQLSTGAAGG